MIRRLVKALAARLPPPRVIFDRNGRSPYLSRYYLLGAPTMPDGSWPFAPNGAPRDGVIWPKSWLGVYLHRFHRGDDELELHNHPWRWAVSLVLVGGYVEERRTKNDRVIARIVRPWRLNFISSSTFHRVDLLSGDAWTLFVVGPKFTGWGFWNRHSRKFVPWREFISQLRDPVAYARDKASAR